MSDSDVWASDDDDSSRQQQYERQLAERAYAKLEATHSTLGYTEGVVEGKDRTMQTGFDRGYKEGAQAGWRVGRLRGQVSALEAHLAATKADDAAMSALHDRVQTLFRDVQDRLKVETLFTQASLSGASGSSEHVDRIVAPLEQRSRELVAHLRQQRPAQEQQQQSQ
ncbi:hypothetical protein RI367_002473 [Sorochytrium milnesiophthora]